jgi:hypothetical protein
MRKISLALAAVLVGASASCAGVVDRDGRGGTIAVGATADGTLGIGDPVTPLPGRGGSYRADLWTVSLTMGQPITIAMCETVGSDFDPYLVVENAGMDNHYNDDSGGGYHGHGSLLTFTPTATATYTIYASTFRTLTGDTVGDYTLQVMAGDMTSTFHCPQ